MFEGKTILITGGSGSLGNALVERLLKYDVEAIRILSRNESKQVEMQNKFGENKLRFLIGDVRDRDRLSRAIEDVDIVFHAAALKHVPLIEYNPNEAIMTNVIGTQNVVMECAKQNVEKVVGIGTDKAVSPLNTYGTTKHLMEKIITTASRQFSYKRYDTKFFTVRYGNVAGSSGSVIPLFVKQIKENKKITITDPKMTRFNISMNQAVDFILSSTEMAIGTEVFIPKLKAYNIMDLKDALTDLINPAEHEIINSRPGEKIHELLMNRYEIRDAKDLGDRYVLLDPQSFDKNLVRPDVIETYQNIQSVKLDGEYSSDKVQLMTKNELKDMISDFV